MQKIAVLTEALANDAFQTIAVDGAARMLF